eukprot:366000-Chlamydomonas_euryale.AAC.40
MPDLGFLSTCVAFFAFALYFRKTREGAQGYVPPARRAMGSTPADKRNQSPTGRGTRGSSAGGVNDIVHPWRDRNASSMNAPPAQPFRGGGPGTGALSKVETSAMTPQQQEQLLNQIREMFKQQQHDMQAMFSSWAAVLADRVAASVMDKLSAQMSAPGGMLGPPHAGPAEGGTGTPARDTGTGLNPGNGRVSVFDRLSPAPAAADQKPSQQASQAQEQRKVKSGFDRYQPPTRGGGSSSRDHKSHPYD